jgi:GT2 family glycosyltransferase
VTRHLDDVENGVRERIDRLQAGSTTPVEVEASVVVVLYRTSRAELTSLLHSLDEQTTSDFEVIAVDNGTDWDVRSALAQIDLPYLYAPLEENYGVTVGRNLGGKLARGEILLFLDDDAVPRRDLVEQHCRVHRKRDIVAARGKVLPRSDAVYNRIQGHYDLGDEVIPYYLNIEGNTSFDRETFLTVGGYDEQLIDRAGHEGIELTHRLVQSEIDRDEIVYYPKAVIYHDYASSLLEYLRKRVSRNPNREYLLEEHPEIFEFTASYEATVETPNLTRGDELKMLALSALVMLVDLVAQGPELRAARRRRERG